MDRLGQKIGYFEQENSANPYAKWPNFTRENQGEFVAKIMGFEARRIRQPSLPTWPNFASPQSLFFSSQIKKNISLHLKFKLLQFDLFLWEKTAHPRREKRARFLVGIVAEILVATCQDWIRFFKEN